MFVLCIRGLCFTFEIKFHQKLEISSHTILFVCYIYLYENVLKVKTRHFVCPSVYKRILWL